MGYNHGCQVLIMPAPIPRIWQQFRCLYEPDLIRWLGLGVDSRMASEEAAARLDTARAALAALADFSKDASIDPAVLQRLRAHYERRIADLHDASAHELARRATTGQTLNCASCAWLRCSPNATA